MKTVLVVSVVLTSLAGAAAAGMMMSTPTRSVGTVAERPAPQPVTPQASATPVSAPPASAVPVQAAAAPSGPSPKSASVEAARPPVPLRVTHKPPLPEKPVAADKKASTDGKAGTDTPEKSESAPDEKTQQAARAAIEADGYKGVQILSQGSNGVWKASALRGKTRVVVSVDQAGNVFTE
jgi:hypothetical protein